MSSIKYFIIPLIAFIALVLFIILCISIRILAGGQDLFQMLINIIRGKSSRPRRHQPPEANPNADFDANFDEHHPAEPTAPGRVSFQMDMPTGSMEELSPRQNEPEVDSPPPKYDQAVKTPL